MSVFTDPSEVVLDPNGAPSVRASYSFYAGNSNTPLDVFTDAARTTKAPRPLTTDLAGRRPVVFLPFATAEVSTYRVVCRDAFGGVIYEATDQPLPAGSSAGPSSASFALPLVPVRASSGSLSLTLTATTFSGLLNVNASITDVTVVLPAFSSLTPGQSMQIRQSGSGSAVIIVPANGDPVLDGYKAWPLLDTGEIVSLVVRSADVQPISAALLGPVFTVASRPTTALPSPALAGRFYLAGLDVTGAWSKDQLYRADGIGGWITVPQRAGLLALVQDEINGGSPSAYCCSGSAWAKWSVVSGQETMVLHVEASPGSPGGTPVYGAWTRTDLTTVVENSIDGGSLSGGVVTLPAGVYDVDGARAGAALGASAARFWSVASDIGVQGLNQYQQGEQVGLTVSGSAVVAGAGSTIETRVGGGLPFSGSFTITAQTTFELQYYSATAPAGGGKNTDLGAPLSLGTPEVYGIVRIRKRA